MKSILEPSEAAAIVDRSDKTLRAVLRKLKALGALSVDTAWQEPDQLNGNWFIRRSFLRELARDRKWPFREHL